jgi:hypothetical protein
LTVPKKFTPAASAGSRRIDMLRAAAVRHIASFDHHLVQRQDRSDVLGLRRKIEQHHRLAPRGQQGGGLAADQAGAGDQRAHVAAFAAPSLKTR